MKIGERIRAERVRAVLSQGELAEKAGISRTALSQIESGVALPRPSTIRKIADALGIPAPELADAWISYGSSHEYATIDDLMERGIVQGFTYRMEPDGSVLIEPDDRTTSPGHLA